MECLPGGKPEKELDLQNIIEDLIDDVKKGVMKYIVKFTKIGNNTLENIIDEQGEKLKKIVRDE